MTNPIGIMQGRLSPLPPGRPQVFPVDTWRQEFELARECGFDGIEWLVTDAYLERNALFTTAGRIDIRTCAEAADMPVLSVCADVFLDQRFVRVPAVQRQQAERLLLALIEACVSLGIPRIVVPILETAGPTVSHEVDELCEALRESMAAAASSGIRIALESDLSEAALEVVLQRLPSAQVCVDTGNSAARGADAASELRHLGARVAEVHIKDRPVGGVNVPLGDGAVNFMLVATCVREYAAAVPLILETAVGADPLESARRNLSRTRAWFSAGGSVS